MESLKLLGGDKAAAGVKAMGQGAAVKGVKNTGGGMGKAIGGLFGGGDKTNAPASTTR